MSRDGGQGRLSGDGVQAVMEGRAGSYLSLVASVNTGSISPLLHADTGFGCDGYHHCQL